MERVFSLDNINDVAKECWKAIGDYRVIAFHGEMGAGKTTFIHALCDVKGVTDAVGSPTFSIINEYGFVSTGVGSVGTKSVLFHMDLYRLKDEEEARQAGVEDALYSGYPCLVEWPEKAPGIFPANTIHVYIELAGNNTRKLKIANN
jgi:tRNA threonylcarbamoyladenosine biosynthesis protein TsaE